MWKTITAGAVAAVATVGVTVAVHASSAEGAPPRCVAGSMQPDYRGKDTSGSTTSSYWRLTNVGSSACTLYGWPYFVNYRGDGRTMYSSNKHTGTPHVVTVGRGEHAQAKFSYPTPTSKCPAAKSAGMTLSWDGTPHPVIAEFGVRACNGTATASPFVHG